MLEFQPSGLCKWCVHDRRMTEGSSVINVCLVGLRVFGGHWSLCLENYSFFIGISVLKAFHLRRYQFALLK